jgi:hypothetical protein
MLESEIVMSQQVLHVIVWLHSDNIVQRKLSLVNISFTAMNSRSLLPVSRAQSHVDYCRISL